MSPRSGHGGCPGGVVESRLVLLMAGALQEREAEDLWSHVRTCDACFASIDLLDRVAHVAPDLELPRSVQREARASGAPRPRYAAAAIVLATLGVMIWYGLRSQPPREPLDHVLADRAYEAQDWDLAEERARAVVARGNVHRVSTFYRFALRVGDFEARRGAWARAAENYGRAADAIPKPLPAGWRPSLAAVRVHMSLRQAKALRRSGAAFDRTEHEAVVAGALAEAEEIKAPRFPPDVVLEARKVRDQFLVWRAMTEGIDDEQAFASLCDGLVATGRRIASRQGIPDSHIDCVTTAASARLIAWQVGADPAGREAVERYLAAIAAHRAAEENPRLRSWRLGLEGAVHLARAAEDGDRALDGARAALQEALRIHRERLDPPEGTATLHRNLGATLACLGDLDGARTAFDAALLLARGEEALTLVRAARWAYLGEGDPPGGLGPTAAWSTRKLLQHGPTASRPRQPTLALLRFTLP